MSSQWILRLQLSGFFKLYTIYTLDEICTFFLNIRDLKSSWGLTHSNSPFDMSRSEINCINILTYLQSWLIQESIIHGQCL